MDDIEGILKDILLRARSCYDSEDETDYYFEQFFGISDKQPFSVKIEFCHEQLISLKIRKLEIKNIVFEYQHDALNPWKIYRGIFRKKIGQIKFNGTNPIVKYKEPTNIKTNDLINLLYEIQEWLLFWEQPCCHKINIHNYQWVFSEKEKFWTFEERPAFSEPYRIDYCQFCGTKLPDLLKTNSEKNNSRFDCILS